MNRKTFLLALALSALLHVTATDARAQGRELKADIPFNFTVCTQQFPAGTYKVRPVTTSTTNILLVRGEDNQSAEIACTHDVQSSERASEGKLVFNRYGDQYFLSEVWFPGEMSGNQLFRSDREDALIKELPPKMKRGKVTIKITEAKPN